MTLVEVLLVLSIVALLVAISLPVLRNAADAAKRSSCSTKLQQIHHAISLYREVHGRVEYGHPAAMGLPFRVGALGLPLESVRCSGGTVRLAPGQAADPFTWFVLRHDDKQYFGTKWTEYVQVCRDRSILVADLSHDFPGKNPYTPLQTHRGIGLLVGGAVKTRTEMGSASDIAFWSCTDKKAD